MVNHVPVETAEFAKENDIVGLTFPSLTSIQNGKPGYSIEKAHALLDFQKRIDSELLQHKVITNNEYTSWFKNGEASFEQVQAFIVQFSVFSNLFLVAQLKKMINAPSLETMRATKEILANEIGVIFNSPQTSISMQNVTNKDLQGDPELVALEGTIEGGNFRFQAAHFEWLMKIAAKLGLGFKDIGKRHLGTPATLHFCDELARLYGSESYDISQAASYAVENWAAAGFWKALVQGLSCFKDKLMNDLPLAFFTWHDRIEDQHAQHTQEELEEYFFQNYLDQDRFLCHGNEMMEAILVFWDGLNEQRRSIRSR